MLRKAKLIKKHSIEIQAEMVPKPTVVAEAEDRILLTQRIIQTTRDWLVSNRQQQNNARQTFAQLFMNSDTPSNAS